MKTILETLRSIYLIDDGMFIILDSQIDIVTDLLDQPIIHFNLN